MAVKKFTLAEQFTSREAEERLLAAILRKPETFYEIVDTAPQDVWYHLQDEFQQVADAITEEKDLPALSLDVEPGADPEALAKTLADLYQKRKTAALLERMLGELHQDTPATELIAQLEQGLTNIQSALKEIKLGQIVNAPTLFSDVLFDVEKRYQAVKEHGVQAVGLPTKIKTLDKYLGGLQEGIHLLAAEPGQGKTTFALQIARAVSEQGFPVIFVSFEETLQRLVLKCLCALGRKEIKRFADGYGSAKELEPIIQEHGWKLSNLHFIQGTKNLSVNQVKAKAKQLMQKAGKDKCLIIIDYLQRWAAHMRETSYTDFRHTVRDLTADIREKLALQLNSPVVVISSQNRTGQGQNKLTSLKESGDLEYDADSAMFLTKPENGENKALPFEGMRHVVLHLEKNRYGDKGKIDLMFHAGMGYFTEMDNKTDVFNVF